MTVSERLILLLLALPFSTVLAAGVYWVLGVATGYRLAAAALVFIASELILQHLASRIRSRVGPESLVGRQVEALSDFRPDPDGVPAGYVRIDGERWQARIISSKGAELRRGTKLRVERVDGLVLWVTVSDSPGGQDGL